MADIRMNNVPQLSVNKIVSTLSDVYVAALKSKSLQNVPSVMLWGAPGIGKSQAVRQIADEVGARSGKKTKVTDVRLMLFNPIDLRGIPTANADKTLAVWLKPQIFQMDESDRVVNFLFLDEITSAPQSVQAAAYQITLDKVIGEHKLPKNCVVIAAGNRASDKSVAYKMPKALSNRLLHFEVDENFEEWKKWAISVGLNEKVVGFLTFKEDCLNTFATNNDDVAFATPRSWEMVGKLLDIVDDPSEQNTLIGGLVGTGIAVEFRSWRKVYAELPDIAAIFDGREARVPKNTDALYALVSSMVHYASEHREDFDKIINSIRYADKLPPDFAVVLIRDYMAIEKDYKLKLLKLPEFVRWVSEKGKVLNGII